MMDLILVHSITKVKNVTYLISLKDVVFFLTWVSSPFRHLQTDYFQTWYDDRDY